jgi:hypothetical protein
LVPFGFAAVPANQNDPAMAANKTSKDNAMILIFINPFPLKNFGQWV